MDVSHGFVGIGLVSSAPWKARAVSHPKGTRANHVLSQFGEVSEERQPLLGLLLHWEMLSQQRGAASRSSMEQLLAASSGDRDFK